MAIKKIQVTKNYAMFERHGSENRPLDPGKHRKLKESMKQYGFLSCFPIVVHRNGNGKMIVDDGQHRLLFAETLGLPVHWVEEDISFDVAVINSTPKVWNMMDFAKKHAANKLDDYQECIDFADRHSVPIGTAAALLTGHSSFGNCNTSFVDGKWRIKDRKWADAVAAIYVPLVNLAPKMRNARLIEACMAVCRVEDFDAKRLLSNAERCREKLVPYSHRDAYLDMLETVYNFGRAKLVGLKSAAIMAMRDRMPNKKKPA